MHRFVLAGVFPALLTLAVGASATAQFPAAPQGNGAAHLTESEFLARLNAGHPAVLELREELGIAQSEVLAAKAFANPALDVVREDPDGPIAQTEWSVFWQLPDWNRRRRISASQSAVEAAEARFDVAVQSLRTEMRRAYAEWAVAEQRRVRLEAYAQRLAQLADREALRAERGESSELSAHRLRLAAAALRAEVSLAASDAAEARTKVLAWDPELAAEAMPVLPPVQPAPELAIDGSRRIQAVEAEAEATELADQAARSYLSAPEVRLGWQQQESGAQSFHGPVVGVSWSIPLWNRNQAERARTATRHNAALSRLELVLRSLASSIEAERARAEALAAAVARARDQLDGNERMLAGAEAAFLQGESTLTDLLDTHSAVLGAQLRTLDLVAAALAAQRDLELLTVSSPPFPSIPISSKDPMPSKEPSP